MFIVFEFVGCSLSLLVVFIIFVIVFFRDRHQDIDQHENHSTWAVKQMSTRVLFVSDLAENLLRGPNGRARTFLEGPGQNLERKSGPTFGFSFFLPLVS